MDAGGPTRPVCEVDRAFRELLGRPQSSTPEAASVCSPEPPELRVYPAARTPASNYVLCNGHLRDLFDELAQRPLPDSTAVAH